MSYEDRTREAKIYALATVLQDVVDNKDKYYFSNGILNKQAFSQYTETAALRFDDYSTSEQKEDFIAQAQWIYTDLSNDRTLGSNLSATLNKLGDLIDEQIIAEQEVAAQPVNIAQKQQTPDTPAPTQAPAQDSKETAAKAAEKARLEKADYLDNILNHVNHHLGDASIADFTNEKGEIQIGGFKVENLKQFAVAAQTMGGKAIAEMMQGERSTRLLAEFQHKGYTLESSIETMATVEERFEEQKSGIASIKGGDLTMEQDNIIARVDNEAMDFVEKAGKVAAQEVETAQQTNDKNINDILITMVNNPDKFTRGQIKRVEETARAMADEGGTQALLDKVTLIASTDGMSGKDIDWEKKDRVAGVSARERIALKQDKEAVATLATAHTTPNIPAAQKASVMSLAGNLLKHIEKENLPEKATEKIKGFDIGKAVGVLKEQGISDIAHGNPLAAVSSAMIAGAAPQQTEVGSHAR